MQLLTLLALASACSGTPIASVSAALNPWVKPKSTDSRSPCPLLNTLANHGYLPHDGKDITTQMIGDAILASTNWSTDFGTVAGAAALGRLNATSISLGQLNSTAGGEHPASLTRNDASSGNSNTLSITRLNAFLGDSTSNYITISSIAKTRSRIEAAENPQISAGDQGVSQAEAALLMLLMRDTYSEIDDLDKLRAPKDRVKAWLVDEKFPTAQGWKPADVLVEQSALGPVISAIAAAQAAL
ncbi:putative chloroperoxidase [Xylariaceae sp. FL1019]|nr:putative chloroperoxidase [Xylariaceae sp. FL1019]